MTTITKTHDRPANPNNAAPDPRGYLVPQVNIVQTKDSFILEAEMPGGNNDGIEVLLEGSELTIIGRRHTAVPDAQPVYRESSPQDFRREFVLDQSIDTLRITAKIEQGVLTVQLPKAEKVKPRKITVSG